MAVVALSVGEDPAQLHVLVNPEIVWREGLETDVEGCLSLPGISDKVDRPTAIRVRAVDLAGRPFELAAEGWLARAVCHEVDHLDGILFTDHLRGLRRAALRPPPRPLGAGGEQGPPSPGRPPPLPRPPPPSSPP